MCAGKKVVVEKYGIPDDVAGATLMALGCNGPELFTNVLPGGIFFSVGPASVSTWTKGRSRF